MALSAYEAAFAVLVVAAEARHRDRAIVALTMVTGLATSLYYPLVGWLDGRFGWRTTLLVLALSQAVIARVKDVTDEPEVTAFDFPRVLAAVADPIRLSIVRQLAEAEDDLTCGAIELPVKASTATHHFTALRQTGVLHQYYIGTSRMNVLRTDDMEQAFPGFLTALIAGATKRPPV